MSAFPTRILIISGVVIITGGLFYDLLFAGIPYQDPTPEMSARYELHSGIAAIIYVIGIGALIVGMLRGIARALVRKRKARELMK